MPIKELKSGVERETSIWLEKEAVPVIAVKQAAFEILPWFLPETRWKLRQVTATKPSHLSEQIRIHQLPLVQLLCEPTEKTKKQARFQFVASTKKVKLRLETKLCVSIKPTENPYWN